MSVPFAPSRLSPLPPAPPSRLSRLLRSSRRNSFRNNTCKPIPRFSRNQPKSSAPNPFGIRTYKICVRNSFRIRTYKKRGEGWTDLPLPQPTSSIYCYFNTLRAIAAPCHNNTPLCCLPPFARPVSPPPLPPRPRQLDRAAPRTLHSSCIFPGRLHARGGHRRRRLSRLASLRSPHRRRLGRAFSRQPRHRRRLQRRPSPQASALPQPPRRRLQLHRRPRPCGLCAPFRFAR